MYTVNSKKGFNDSDIANKKMANDGEDLDRILQHFFELNERGRREIQLREEYRNVILLLGDTGVGKSTLIQFLTDDSRLVAREVARGQFLIEDGDRISNSTIFSQTLFPDLVIDSIHNVALYDCPGFSDTRSASYDLATTCFIKLVADFALNLKLIFVINYSAVRRGEERIGFMRLMKYITLLVKDINKFRNSIGLIITKVDNIYAREEQTLTLVNDDLVITDVAGFLSEVHQSLNERLQEQDCTETMFYETAINIIDILLTKREDTFTRIGLFRKPDIAGPLNEITSYQNSKNKIHRILFENLKFTKKGNYDFGYGLSEQSKNVINSINEDINGRVWESFREIASYAKEFFINLNRQIVEKIQLFVSAVGCMDDEEMTVKRISSKLKNGPLVIENLVERIKNSRDLEQIVVLIINDMESLDVTIPTETMSFVRKQGSYLNFLQTICERELNSPPWETVFKDTLLYFEESKMTLMNIVEEAEKQINDQFKGHLTILAKALQEEYIKEMKTSNVYILQKKLSEASHMWNNKIEKLDGLTLTEQRVETFCDQEKFSEISEAPLNQIKRILKVIVYIKQLSDMELTIELSSFLVPSQCIIQFLHESNRWYNFLLELSAKLSEYEIQVNKHLLFAEDGELSEIVINSDTFDSFLSELTQYSTELCNDVRSLILSEYHFQELNSVLNKTLRSKAIVDYSDGILTIKGDFISLESIFNNERNAYVENESPISIRAALASRELKTVIFISNTIFIDRDIELGGGHMVIIIAQKWEIIDSRKINLSGKNGFMPSFNNHNSSQSTMKKANNGKPGNPGGPGGFFFGLGQKFINGKWLTIFADGGKGSPGQKGQDGKNGEDAAVVQIPFYIFWERTIGNRGKRGFPGKVKIMELSSSSRIVISNKKGKNGDNGRGGKGGLSGENYPGFDALYTSEVPSGRDPPASEGTDGVDITGLKLPEQRPVFKEFSSVIKEYKIFLENNYLNDRFRNISLTYLKEIFNVNKDFSEISELKLWNCLEICNCD